MSRQDIPVVILAGGLGTRLREETEFRPKPMVPIGGKPILWHIMKHYSYYGFYRFIICLGYKGEMIKRYFLNYRLDDADFTVNTRTGSITEHHINDEEWEITLVDTGQSCMTGGRVARIGHHINTPQFMLTYGDGVSNVNITNLLQHHEKQQRLVTVTGVTLPSRFGHFQVTDGNVTEFIEKRTVEDEWINGGFFVCERPFLDYLSENDECVLEQQPLRTIAAQGQLALYQHRGFWQCMDSQRERLLLEQLWNEGAPWKVWQDKSFTPAQKDTSSSLADPNTQTVQSTTV